jgi:hypothetical protein
MKLRELVRSNLFGLPTMGRDDYKLNRLTLSFRGEIQSYEKDFRSRLL